MMSAMIAILNGADHAHDLSKARDFFCLPHVVTFESFMN